MNTKWYMLLLFNLTFTVTTTLNKRTENSTNPNIDKKVVPSLQRETLSMDNTTVDSDVLSSINMKSLYRLRRYTSNASLFVDNSTVELNQGVNNRTNDTQSLQWLLKHVTAINNNHTVIGKIINRFERTDLFERIKGMSGGCAVPASGGVQETDSFVIQSILENICDLDELFEIIGIPTVVFIEIEYTMLLQDSLRYCNATRQLINLVSITSKDKYSLTKHLHQFIETDFSSFLLLTFMETSTIILDIAARHEFHKPQFVWVIPYYLMSITALKFPDIVILLEKNWTCNLTYSKEIACVSSPPFNRTKRSSLTTNCLEGYRGYEFSNTNKKWTYVLSKTKNNSITVKNIFLNKLPNVYKYFMRNKYFRVATIIDPPFIMMPSHLKVANGKCSSGHLCWKTELVNNKKVKVSRCCIGLCMDMLKMIENELGIETRLYLVEDGFYGSKVEGKWIGMIGDIVRDKADIIVAPIIASELRETAVDFSEPYMHGGMALATVISKKILVLFSSHTNNVFSTLMWIGILLATIIPAALVTFIELMKCSEREEYSLSEGILFFTGLTFQRDIGGRPPLKTSSLVITRSVAIFMMVVISTYTAVLTANIVTHVNVSPVSGWKDKKLINPSNEFIYGVENNTSYDDKFRTSLDPTWRHMHTFMKRYAFNGVLDGIQKLQSGKLQAIISDYYVMKYYMAFESDCKIRFAGTPVPDVGYGIVVQKGSPMKGIFSKLMIKYKNDLVIEQLKRKWFSDACDEKETGLLQQTGWVYFQNIFYICAAAIGLCLLLLSIEHIIHTNRGCSITDGNTILGENNLSSEPDVNT